MPTPKLPPAPRPLGGRARRITLTLDELAQRCDRAFELGVEEGIDTARTLLREQIADELADELRTDPACALCRATRTIDELRAELTRAELDRNAARARNREWATREGRYRYRETRSTPPRREQRR